MVAHEIHNAVDPAVRQAPTVSSGRQRQADRAVRETRLRVSPLADPRDLGMLLSRPFDQPLRDLGKEKAIAKETSP